MLVIAGAMASQHLLHPTYVWIAAAIGAWSGHIVWFIVGRGIGKKVVKNFALRHGFSKKIALINKYIEKNKTKAVIILQYLYGVRMIGAISFGISEIRFLWFATIQLINCMVWAFAIGMVGFSLGKTASIFSHSTIHILWIISSLLILVFIFKKILRLS